jgi:hypothetical protein
MRNWRGDEEVGRECVTKHGDVNRCERDAGGAYDE